MTATIPPQAALVTVDAVLRLFSDGRHRWQMSRLPDQQSPVSVRLTHPANPVRYLTIPLDIKPSELDRMLSEAFLAIPLPSPPDPSTWFADILAYK